MFYLILIMWNAQNSISLEDLIIYLLLYAVVLYDVWDLCEENKL